MAYTFDPIFATDPNNAANVAANAAIILFDPADVGQAPITITDVTGAALPNPITVNKNGFGPAFVATIDRVAWAGGGFTGYFTSYEGLKAVAVDAAAAAAASQTAAETAVETAGAPADAAIAAAVNGTGEARVALDSAYVRFEDEAGNPLPALNVVIKVSATTGEIIDIVSEA